MSEQLRKGVAAATTATAELDVGRRTNHVAREATLAEPERRDGCHPECQRRYRPP